MQEEKEEEVEEDKEEEEDDRTFRRRRREEGEETAGGGQQEGIQPAHHLHCLCRVFGPCKTAHLWQQPLRGAVPQHPKRQETGPSQRRRQRVNVSFFL